MPCIPPNRAEEKLLAAGACAQFWPRWREELQRCTGLDECLRGLSEDLAEGLAELGGAVEPCCGGWADGGEAGWGAPEE